MDRFTAGYIGHDGYPVTLAGGNSLPEVIVHLPFGDDANSRILEDAFSPGSNATAKIMEAIQKAEGAAGWVREAPYTLEARCVEDGYWKVKWEVSGTTFNDVITSILYRSERFAKQVDDASFGGEQDVAVTDIHVGSRRISAFFATAPKGFEITGLSVGNEFSPEDVETLALMYSNPGDGVTSARLLVSPTAEVEQAARAVEHAEKARLNAVRRASEEGVSQRVLASLAGVSQATIGRWLKGDVN